MVRVFCGPTAEDARKLYCILDREDYLKEEADMKAKTGFVMRNVVGEHVVMPVGDNIVSVQHETGTTAEDPIVFLADEDGYGLTTTSRLDAGQYKNGHLDIQRGTFTCKYIEIGNGGSTVDCLIKVGGSGHNASLTVDGGNSQCYRGKLLVGAKGVFSFNAYFKTTFKIFNWHGKQIGAINTICFRMRASRRVG